MYLCYIDESGTSNIPGNTSHFVLAGVSIPIWHWRDADRDVSAVMNRYGLEDAELHTAWLLRTYLEQSRIQDFNQLNRADRRSAIVRYRNADLLRLQREQLHRTYRQNKKNYRKTEAYVHLTLDERRALIFEIADRVSNWVCPLIC